MSVFNIGSGELVLMALVVVGFFVVLAGAVFVGTRLAHRAENRR